MEKPFTLIIKEMEEEIIKIINKSNLPAYNIKLSLQNIYNGKTIWKEDQNL